jgi:predicted Zn-dependent protease with MMP-like domain
MSPDFQKLSSIAEFEIAAILESLPPPLRTEARPLPVVFQARPDKSLIADGIEPDTLGLFVGEPFAEIASTSSAIPSHIVLFLQNIWEVADPVEESFREEVRTTYLHELGHFLGLNESDLEERGLE